MSILIDENTRFLNQGITGRFGQGVARRMIEVGTKVVVGVTPGRRGQSVWGVPVYNTIKEAIEEVDCEFGILEDAGIACDAIGLNRTSKRIDLLVGWNCIIVVAKLRSKDLRFAPAVDIDPVIPVNDVLVEIIEAHVLAQVFGAPFGAL